MRPSGGLQLPELRVSHSVLLGRRSRGRSRPYCSLVGITGFRMFTPKIHLKTSFFLCVYLSYLDQILEFKSKWLYEMT